MPELQPMSTLDANQNLLATAYRDQTSSNQGLTSRLRGYCGIAVHENLDQFLERSRS
jgi:hypothetical protein